MQSYYYSSIKPSARMMVPLFIFTIILHLANAQDYVESDNDSNRSNGYGNNSGCISKYRDLDWYVVKQ